MNLLGIFKAGHYLPLIKKSFAFAFFTAVILPSQASDFNASFKSCLKAASEITPSVLSSCRREERSNRFKIISHSQPIDLIKGSYTTSLGLGDPAFSELKAKRDAFVEEHINKPIAEIEEVRDRNIQKYNLKTLYGDTGEKETHNILSKLESAFGLDSLQATFSEFIENRKQSCEVKFEAKSKTCSEITDIYDKSQCLASAYDIKNNCFKYTTKNSKLNSVKNKLSQWEDKILADIAEVSFVDNDEVQKLYSISKTKLGKLDNKINTLNEKLSLNIGGKLNEYLSSVDPVKMIEERMGEELGIGSSLVGAGSFTRTNTQDILNFSASKKTSLNNLCDLTTCLVYPDSRKYTDDTKSKYSYDYQSKCADKGLTSSDLDEKVNEIRRQLTVLVGKLVLQKIMVEVPVKEYMDQVKRSVMCASHATVAAIADGISSSSDGSCTTCSSESAKLSSGVAAVSKTEERSAKCLEEAADQASTEKDVQGQVGLGKVSGWLTGTLQSVGLFTIAENVPFATPSVQVKGNLKNIITEQLTSTSTLQACQKEGQSETWIENYNKCVADDISFNLGFEFNFKLPELFEALRSSTELQCESSLKAIPISTTITFDALYNNPDVTPKSYSNDHSRWSTLSMSMISAQESLSKMKINPSLFFETSEASCAYKSLDIVTNQISTSNPVECSILDIDNPPEIDWTVADLDDFGKGNGEVLPSTLVPSVRKLCEDSSKIITEHFADLKAFSQSALRGIKSDPDSVYNVKNSILKPNSPDNSKYRITRSIANIHFCSSFFTNIANKRILKDQDISVYQNISGYLDRLALNRGELSYSEYINKKEVNRKYQQTLKTLNRRSQKEKYKLCITNSTYREVDYAERVGIKKAVFDFCKTYKIERFDKYFSDSLTDFDFPLVESNVESVKRIESLKKIRIQEYRGSDL